MASGQKEVSLGPYVLKQKLYLETEDGQAMEGEFVKLNASQANPSVLLHRVEFIPTDGRVFEQYNALLSELVCLRPLEPSANVSSISVAKQPEADPRDPNNIVLPDIADQKEVRQQNAEKMEKKRVSICQMLAERGLINDIHPDVLKQLQKPIRSLPPKNKIAEKPPLGETKRDIAAALTPSDRSSDDRKHQEPPVNGEIASDSPPIPTNGMYEALKSKAKGYFIIDKPGPLMQSAFQDIEKRSILGLGSHGQERGRLDRLSLLTVATESAVYLFDIQSLGKQAFQKQLTEALQSSTVEKVTYDCRYLSDCLNYVHRVRLQNVYDVQAADCVLHRCRVGSFPTRGRGLQEIVAHYLDLPSALLRDTTNITNYKVWYQRPLQDECFDYASWQVAPLLQLRTAIDKRFQHLMRNSFDVYLSDVRKLPRADINEALAKRRQIPVDALNAPFDRDS